MINAMLIAGAVVAIFGGGVIIVMKLVDLMFEHPKVGTVATALFFWVVMTLALMFSGTVE